MSAGQVILRTHLFQTQGAFTLRAVPVYQVVFMYYDVARMAFVFHSITL